MKKDFFIMNMNTNGGSMPTKENYCGHCDNGAALPGSAASLCRICGRTPKVTSPYPELDKMKEARPKAQVLSEFIDWLDQNGMRICRPSESEWAHGGAYDAIVETPEVLLAQYFGIDLTKVEEERRKILEIQRALNALCATERDVK